MTRRGETVLKMSRLNAHILVGIFTMDGILAELLTQFNISRSTNRRFGDLEDSRQELLPFTPQTAIPLKGIVATI